MTPAACVPVTQRTPARAPIGVGATEHGGEIRPDRVKVGDKHSAMRGLSIAATPQHPREGEYKHGSVSRYATALRPCLESRDLL